MREKEGLAGRRRAGLFHPSTQSEFLEMIAYGGSVLGESGLVPAGWHEQGLEQGVGLQYKMVSSLHYLLLCQLKKTARVPH
jgi:hypothetical protein